MSRSPRWLHLLLADKRKLSAAALLVVVALVLWGRLLLPSAEPKSAQASVPSASVAPRAVSAGPGPVRPQAPRQTLVSVDLPQTLNRDLFALAATAYPRVRPAEPAPAPAKSVPEAVDNSAQAQTGAKAAAGLVLQTTILGPKPRAMIDGQLVSVGDRIGGWLVLRILPRQVLLEMNGVQVTLDM